MLGLRKGRDGPDGEVWMSMWTEYNPHSVVVRAIIPRSVLAKTPRHGRCSPQRLATGMVSPVPDARPSCALNRIFECSLAQRRSRLREQSCSSRDEGVETVLLKFNRLFAETNLVHTNFDTSGTSLARS